MDKGQELKEYPHNELARRLCAAFVSYPLAVGVDYALEHYVPQTPGEGWQELAEDIARSASEEFGKAFLRPTLE